VTNLKKNNEVPGEIKSIPPGTSLVVLKNPPKKDGTITTREQIKDEKGKFIKKVKPLIPTVEFVRARRKRLAQVRSDG